MQITRRHLTYAAVALMFGQILFAGAYFLNQSNKRFCENLANNIELNRVNNKLLFIKVQNTKLFQTLLDIQKRLSEKEFSAVEIKASGITTLGEIIGQDQLNQLESSESKDRANTDRLILDAAKLEIESDKASIEFEIQFRNQCSSVAGDLDFLYLLQVICGALFAMVTLWGGAFLLESSNGPDEVESE